MVDRASTHGNSELARIDFLDGWRGLAIGFVLTSHFLPIKVIDLGRMGVDVFFVLSGMLMSNILYVKRVPLGTFYKRRISRVFPAFVLFLSLIYLSSFLFHSSEEHYNYLYTLLFLRSYAPASPDLWHTGLPIGHIWSLNVETHCYILLGILTSFAALKNKEYVPLILLGIGTILLRCIYTKFPSIATKSYELKTEIVASHLLISAGYFLVKERFEKYIPKWLPLVTFAFAILCYSVLVQWWFRWLISPFILAFTVNHLGLLPNFFKSILEFKPLRLLGIWSFSIYLWQQPFFFYRSYSGDKFILAGPVFLAASVVIGAMSFYFFENPARKYINNNW